MKKNIILTIFFLCIFSNWNAFFWWWNNLDLYKNIDKWISELENKMIIFEANWWLKETWILNEINEIATIKKEKACLDDWKSITQEEFKDIAVKGNIKILSEYISENCKENGSISTTVLKNYSSHFREHYINSKITAEDKSNKIYNISKIWLFSDWILENSWFDLIVDIEEIDKIIFSNDTDYVWEWDVDLWKEIDWLLQSTNENRNNTTNRWNIKLPDMYPTKYKPILYNRDTIDEDNHNITETENEYACYINNDNSRLNTTNINSILNDINDIKIKKNNTSVNNGKVDFDYSNKNNTFSNNYSKVTDNVVWPCDTFFCINIEFIMYQHNLFWSNENITVEYLINRSNEHLRKYASTSLIPAKMSTNLFELWLKDLNLPDIFHMAMQISTKPVPLLRIEKEWKEDETEFASKNLLEKYYDLNWLDYKRRNDLVLLKTVEQEKQSIINSEELTNKNAYEKNNDYANYLENRKTKNRIVDKAIEKRVSYWVLDTFVEQYEELDKFTLSIYHYVENLHTIIVKMREIPIDKW